MLQVFCRYFPATIFVKSDETMVSNMHKHLTGRLLRMLAILLIILQTFAISVSARDNVLSIYRGNAEEGLPFNVTNMFPGDCETNVYNIRVSYKGSIKIYFNAEVRDGYEKLAEVLKCRVVMPGGSEPVYDGLMKNMPDLEHSVSAVKKTEDLSYKISVYLDTSVGNAYKNKELVADFKWWAYTAEEGRPGGGGTTEPVPPPTDNDEPTIPPDYGDEPVTPPDDGDKPITPPPDDGEDNPVTPPNKEESPEMASDMPQPPQEEAIPSTSGNVERPTGELTAPPKTGDLGNPVLWIALICMSLFVIFLIIFFKKRNDEEKEEKNPLIKKLTVCIVIISILTVCLCITTFALVYSIVSVEENIFKTGTVEINLNDGKPIITQDEFLFEPGMTVIKDFFIKNESSDAVYYKIYFDNISGGLEKILDVKISDKETGTKLYEGKAEGLIRENCSSAELSLYETRILTAEFHYPEDSGNKTQNLSMSFDMCAVATQQKHNNGRAFD